MMKMDPRYRQSDFSSKSVICSVERFIRSVETMNETVMVPSRLLNIETSENTEKTPSLLRHGNTDTYTYYSVLNNLKTSLLWGLTDNQGPTNEEKIANENATWIVTSENGKVSSQSDTSSKDSTKGHFRRISSVSSASVASSMSEQESEHLSDAGDSSVDSLEIETVSDITAAMNTHLVGLQQCLAQLSETATYITEKYQEEVSA